MGWGIPFLTLAVPRLEHHTGGQGVAVFFMAASQNLEHSQALSRCSFLFDHWSSIADRNRPVIKVQQRYQPQQCFVKQAQDF